MTNEQAAKEIVRDYLEYSSFCNALGSPPDGLTPIDLLTKLIKNELDYKDN